ncbi:glycosyltransferase [Phyllobacterium salinisoli]|uniref:Glycosyltransferase n=1 Tax=Phyllobacterium salinisoli TaxID=1899321 RepID=A0A368K2D8_9HYPH|nr:glycosyltransferase [Phyllobacterium salinisoli]RCS23556.1 glycosyltransferase [Phyllobacterium salinisoli]
MVSVIIETKNVEEALARTLAGLVNAAVEGLVRDVIVVDHGSTDHTHEVADAAGCIFVEGEALRDVVKRARGEWFLFLEPGSRLLDGWSESARNHIEALPGPARFTRSSFNRPRFLARVFGGNDPLSDGLLMSRRQAVALLKPGYGAQDLARGIATRRLKGEIVPANRA